MELQNTTLDDLASVIGFSATLRLAAWFGARGNLYIPDTVEDGQLLVRLIGLSAAKKLSEEWGHEHIAIPQLTMYEEDSKKRTIAWFLEHGISTRQIAREMRMSERRIQQIQRELESAGLIPVSAPKNSRESGQAKNGGSLKNSSENAAANLPPSFFGKKASA